MASRKLTYNIPGLGNLTANLFGYTQDLYGFLEYYDHIDRFRRINQLGRLRDVFQGAHHNRYEYVFLQLSLISELCQNKRGELGLSSERGFCGKLSNKSNCPSTGELLQCLVLLNNMGYLEGTFSTSRAWLTLIKENDNVRKQFRKGLAEVDLPLFDQVVHNYDYYRFQIVVALFQLQRYKRKRSDMVEFCSSLLRHYVDGDRSNIQIVQLRSLYNSIRQLSFIALDSLYAPVPFNLDLASILLNFDSLLDSLFIKNTTYRIALNNLETVLQNSVYMSSDSCINTARASEDVLEDLEYLKKGASGITDIYYALCPACSVEISQRTVEDLDWLKERKIVQEFRFSLFKDEMPEAILNPVRWESTVRNRIGSSRSRVGILLNSRRTLARVSIGLTTDHDINSLKATLKSVVELNKLRRSMPDTRRINLVNEKDNDHQILTFLLKSIFGWKKKFILENKNRSSSAIFISNGRVDTLKKLDTYLSSASKHLNKDEIFEVKKVRDLIEKLNYSGLTITFVGGIKLFLENSNNESAEFDGMVICPSIKPNNHFAYILEAKNYSNGVTAALNQLDRRVKPHLISGLDMTIEILNNRAAFAKINLT